MFNRSASLAMSTSVHEALAGKLDIKRHSHSILYIWCADKIRLAFLAYAISIKNPCGGPFFRTKGGVHIHEDKVTITAPTAMFIKALDVVLAKMVSSGFQFERVAAIAGATQVCLSIIIIKKGLIFSLYKFIT